MLLHQCCNLRKLELYDYISVWVLRGNKRGGKKPVGTGQGQS